ncbi:MAG: ABC transporter permease subunit [Prosthecobacter sp.]|nr:ABC transporter permease subunit [Prosthecobacter sp.]
MPPQESIPTGSIPPPARTKGEIKVWLTAAGLTVGLTMIGSLLLLIAINGLSVFWPHTVTEYSIREADGSVVKVAGTLVKTQQRRTPTGAFVTEHQIFTGNKDAYNLAFRYLQDAQIVGQAQPPDIYVADRIGYGDSVFRPMRLQGADGKSVAAEDAAFPAEFRRLVDQGIERSRQGLEPARDKLVYRLSTGEERSQNVADILYYYQPNQLSVWGRTRVFLHSIWEFLSAQPRESNTEGGIFPAIFGTVVMTLLMAIMVTPFGIIAAIYMREYARQGIMVRLVRICVNNLAGVPSIVFGVFGVGFFVYGVGGFIDRGVRYPMAPVWWFAAGFAAIGCVAAAVYLSTHNRIAIPTQQKRQKVLRKLEGTLWVVAVFLVVVAVACCPYFHGFFSQSVSTPTFGTGGILWASLTLALMTLPVVIVATEEALVAVPRGVREAALACGASKWQTIQRIVLPGALPGVMTGVILAMARGAGEVAPLMITGVVKLAPSLPLDLNPPFIHAERKFMHLGFHIYDLGFQSPDSEGAKPMVFATTLLLIVLVVALNLAAIQIRAHLRKRFQASAF